MRITEHDAEAPTGARSPYAVMRPTHLAVGVLPIHNDGTVTLVGQQRFALMNFSWEMPEGGAPAGEDPIAGAQRELAEETGVEGVCGSLVGIVERIDDEHHFVILDFLVHLLEAQEARAGDDAAEAVWVPLVDVAEMTLVEGLAEFLYDNEVIPTIL